MAVVDSLRSGILNLDYSEVSRRIEEFIAGSVERSGASGVVVGLSGGVDSSVVATLCVRALSRERVLGLIMPTSFTPKQDILDAEWLASWLGIKTKRIDIDPIVDSFARQLDTNPLETKLRIPFANLRARVRMTLLYFYANAGNMLVAGTGDRSEILIGYFTKYGDGGVDILPIGCLFKSQVRRLATYLGIPERIAYKPSSPQLYPGHRAVDEIPTDYEQLDIILYLLFDMQKEAEEVASETGFSLELIKEVIRRYESSHHKRSLPPVPSIR